MENKSVCPWWMGYFLLIPIRKLTHKPQKILKPFITEGMKVIDYGSAMGYFSLPMAEMVGHSGRVFCFDIQEKMLDKLMLRAQDNELDERIKPILIDDKNSLENLKEFADFALLFAVAHEVSNQPKLFTELARMLKPKGKLLFSEPKGHVSLEAFKRSITLANEAGFVQRETLDIRGGYSVVLERA